MPCQHHDVVLSLGSNQGDRFAWLTRAREALEAWPEIRLLACSPVYETEPDGVPQAFALHRFLNQVVLVTTILAPEVFSNAVHAIEERLGRTRGAVPGSPRTIDIDIIAFGTLRSDAPELTLPHPRARLRRFVLQPLADLRPELVLPGDTRSVSDLLRSLPPGPAVRRCEYSDEDNNTPPRQPADKDDAQALL